MRYRGLQALLLPLSFFGTVAARCDRDNCLRALAATPTKASAFCASYTSSIKTATAAISPYAASCSNSPSRVSSACSCVVTSTPSPPACTPSTIIDGPIRNGGFDSYAILPYGSAAGPNSQPPWYYDRLTKTYGDFINEEKDPGSSYYGYGAAAFHLNGTKYPELPGAVGYLNIPITYCNGVTYAFSLYARQIPYQNYVNYQQCRLSFFTSYAGTIASFETPYFSDQFGLAGPVTWKVYRDNGGVNAKGEYSDILSIIVQCTGRQGVAYPVDTLFEVDSVVVDVAQ
ncbi:MAG: hypothetical protein Q9202_004992 [Teloschistes flavicans]